MSAGSVGGCSFYCCSPAGTWEISFELIIWRLKVAGPNIFFKLFLRQDDFCFAARDGIASLRVQVVISLGFVNLGHLLFANVLHFSKFLCSRYVLKCGMKVSSTWICFQWILVSFLCSLQRKHFLLRRLQNFVSGIGLASKFMREIWSIEINREN